MAEHRPFLLGNQRHQILFDFMSISVFCETQPVAEAKDMRIHGDARNIIGVTQNDVGGLSAATAQASLGAAS